MRGSNIESQKIFNEMPRKKYPLGEITYEESIHPSAVGISENLYPKKVVEVGVLDPITESFSREEIKEITEIEQFMDSFAAKRREEGKWERSPDTAYMDENGNSTRKEKKEWGDPVSRDKFFIEMLQSPGLNEWRTKVPSSQSLVDLMDPLSNNQIDYVARKWLSLSTDARAIRNRAAVMSKTVEEFVYGSEKDKEFKWLSIACGTALPVMLIANKADIKTQLYLADFDLRALESTKRIAAEIDFQGKIFKPSDCGMKNDRINIFKKEDMHQLGKHLDDKVGRPELCDMLGIFEYTGEELGIDSAEFLRTGYDMLSPGGRLIFGQMRSSRKMSDFTMGVVCWPWVKMRSPEEVMEIINKANIPLSSTTLYLTDDGVYIVGVIDKPL